MAVEQDAFLACVLRHHTGELQVDWSKVAAELGMSVGGTKNKYRDITRRLAAAAASSDEVDAKVSKKKVPKVNSKAAATKKPAVKRKPLAKKVDRSLLVEQSEEEVETDTETQEPSAKRQKLAVKAMTKKRKATSVEGSDADDDLMDADQSVEPKTTKPATNSKGNAKPQGRSSEAKEVTAISKKPLTSQVKKYEFRMEYPGLCGKNKPSRHDADLQGVNHIDDPDMTEGDADDEDNADDQGVAVDEI